jgi:hypothetical protein
MRLAPGEHAGPARQFQRQPLQVSFPARFAEAEAKSFAADRLQRIVGQLLDIVAGTGKLVEFPGPVAAGALSPGGIEPLRTRRVSPGGEALIEMCGEMANQRCLQGLAGILAGEVGKQGRQCPLVTEATDQLLPKCRSIRRGRLGARRGYRFG